MSSKERKEHWTAALLGKILLADLSTEVALHAQDLLRKRRVLDFSVQSGLVTARLQQDNERPLRLSFIFPILHDNQWTSLFLRLSQEAYFLASLLAGELPAEVEELLRESGIFKELSSWRDLEMRVNGIKVAKLNTHTASLLLRLVSAVEQDPFLLLVLLGSGKEELIAELQRLRHLQKLPTERVCRDSATEGEEPEMISNLEHFWNLRSNLEELHYNIKADELPGSILKWLDSLPLLGLESEIDATLDEAYARIARLAQSFGLGL